MILHLVDTNEKLVNEWRKSFQEFENVTITVGNILDIAENTIVSPANSHGVMDGGIDQQYTDFWRNISK